MHDATSELPAMRLGEIVLATARYEAMKAWYGRILSLSPASEHKPEPRGRASDAPTRICFYRLHVDHPHQNLIAIFEVPGVSDGSGHTGLHHMQLRNASVAVLQERYRRLRDAGVLPYRSMDHGPTTSLYYRDPDGNSVEIAASNFPTLAEAEAAWASDTFRRNPAGEVIDPESWAP
jgi:catechol-2,3-dioxygenase